MSLRTTTQASLSPVLALALAVGLGLGPPARAETPPADTLDCVITPSAQIDLSSAVPGLLEELRVERSGTVRKGQIIARLEAGVERASATLAEGWAKFETEVLLHQTVLANEVRKQYRMARLYQASTVAQEAKEDADAQAETARLRVRQAKDRRWLRELEAKKADAALERRTVRSPIDGVVLQRFRSVGEFVENQPIVRLADLDPLHVETIVPMDRFGTIEPGMKAIVLPEAPAEGAFEGAVAVVDAAGDAASATFGVRVTLDNPGYRIPAGLRCKLRFELPGSPAMDGAATASTDRPEAPAAAAVSVVVSVPVRMAEEAAVERAGEPYPRVPSAAPVVDVGKLEHDLPVDEGLAPVAEAGPVLPPEAPPTRQAPTEPEVLEQHCASVGPITADALDGVGAAFHRAGIRASKRRSVTHRPAGFVVLGPRLGDDAGIRAYLARLKAKRVRDRLFMGHGAFKGRFSLGSYVPRESAESRQRQLQRLGFDTEIAAWGQQERVDWWLDLRSRPEAVAGQVLARLTPEVRSTLRIEPTACGDLMLTSG